MSENLNKKKTIFRRILLAAFVILPFFCADLRAEGDYELRNVEFQGNSSVPSSSLELLIASKASPGWFLKFLNKFTKFGAEPSYLDPNLIPQDIKKIKNFYSQNGFFKADIKADYSIDSASSGSTLVFHVSEGAPFRFKEFAVSGLDSIPRDYLEEIGRIATIDSTKRYSSKDVTDRRDKILNYLHDNGYMLSLVKAQTVQVDTMNNWASVRLQFAPGKFYLVDTVIVQRTGLGKDLVDDELLRHLLGVRRGDIYSNYMLQQGQVRLYRTNLFSTVLVAGSSADSIKGCVPILVSADVGLLNELSPEIILNNQDNAFNSGLGLTFTRKNFLGGARKLTLSSSVTAQDVADLVKNFSVKDTTIMGYGDLRLGIEQPFLFGAPINTKFETYITLQKRRLEYNSTIYGAKLTLDFELPRYTYFSGFSTYFKWEHTNYLYNKSYIKQYLAADSLLSRIKFDKIQSSNAILGFELSANKTNDQTFPTRGYSLSLQCEDGNSLQYAFSKLSGRDITTPIYYKIVGNSAYFFPFFQDKSASLGTKLKLGYIQAYEGQKYSIALNQRFYGGGSNSVRGWGSRELVPKYPHINFDNSTNEDIEAIVLKKVVPGGFFMVEGTLEARKKLIGAFGAAVFLDYGDCWDSYKDLQFKDVAVAGGFGLRYYSDFVPIRIDFGIKLYDPSDRRPIMEKKFFSKLFRFNLGIGEAF